MKVLITGASGHVGGAIASHLIGLGWEVAGLDCRPAHIPGLARHVQADIGSQSALETIIAGIPPCAGIVHAAATLEKDPYADAISLTNCFGTQQVLKLAKQWHVASFIFLSSVPVIGLPRQHPVTEEHPVDPPTAYHASKLFGEHLVRIANRQREIGATFRLTSPVGPGMPGNRIFSVFVDRARAGQPIHLAGQGSRRQNYVDVRDIARAVELCLKDRVTGLFNIAGGTSISNRELAETCVRVLNSCSPIRFSGKPDSEDGIIWDVSIEKARKRFGYEPLYDVEQSILAYVAASAKEACGKGKRHAAGSHQRYSRQRRGA